MAKFTLKKALIKVTEDEGNAFEVRGLAPKDISQLMSLHKPVMEEIFNQYAAKANMGEMTEDGVATLAAEAAVNMVEQVPGLVAHLICLAADDTEELEEYARLPIGVQLEAVTEIGRLTFEMAGGAKKLLDLVKPMLVAKARSVPNVSPLTIGGGA